ncbi:MAG: TVP38/TMEM64 family protein [Magnetococcales bacterium]|nr:TVP38/TMEM64 family protein [Magnetococcales bacterium]
MEIGKIGAKHFSGAIVVGIFIGILMIDQSLLSRITTELGIFGPIFLILFLTLTQILAPLPGAPGILLSISLYGFHWATVMLMISCAISAVVNFLLARRFGRPLVERLLGSERMTTVDRLVQSDERTLLLFSRAFGFAFFDLVSYAIGLTKIPFQRYILYTVLFSLPPLAIQYFLFKDMDFQSPSGLIFFMVSVIGTGGIIAWFFLRILKAKTENQN